MFNIVVIGKKEHGASNLSLALSAVASKITGTPKSSKVDLEDSEIRKMSGVGHIQISSAGRYYEVIDNPWSGDRVGESIRPLGWADATMLVVDLEEGVPPEAELLLKALSAFSNNSYLASFIDTKGIIDDELVTVAELELRDIFQRLEFSEVDIYVGDAIQIIDCQCVDGSCGTCGVLKQALLAVDQLPEQPTPTDKPFRMFIEHVYEHVVVGNSRVSMAIPFGFVVTGGIEVGEEVEVLGASAEDRRSSVDGIQVFTATRQTAEAGEIVSLRLNSLSKGNVQPPAVVASPGVYRLKRTLDLQLSHRDSALFPGAEVMLLAGCGSAGATLRDEGSDVDQSGARIQVILATPLSVEQGEGVALICHEQVCGVGVVTGGTVES